MASAASPKGTQALHARESEFSPMAPPSDGLSSPRILGTRSVRTRRLAAPSHKCTQSQSTVATSAASVQRLYATDPSPEQAIDRIHRILSVRVRSRNARNAGSILPEVDGGTKFPQYRKNRRTEGVPSSQILERWLDKTLGSLGKRLIGSHSINSKLHMVSPLRSVGLDRVSLTKRGMAREVIDRVYRALYVHSIGFHEALREMSANVADPDVVARIWRAFSHLIEECEGDQFQTGMQDMARENRRIVDDIKTTFEQDLRDARKLHDSAVEERACLMKRLSDITETLGATEGRLGDSRNELSSLKNSYLELYEDKRRVDARCEDVEETCAKQAAVLKQYAQNILDLEASLKDSKERLADKDIDLENEHAKAASLDASLRSARARIKELTNNLAETRGERDEAREIPFSDAQGSCIDDAELEKRARKS